MEKQQTAVQWLFQEVELKCKNKLGPTFAELFQQAKEMEKEEIRTAYMQGQDAIVKKFNLTINRHINSLQYYNETFKNN